jgi:hypothetical protein
MRTSLLFAVGLSVLLAASCTSPCGKLAKAVCDKTKDAKTCESFKQKMKTADKARCTEQLKDVDKVVAGLQGEKVKEAFRDLGADLAKQLVGGPKPPATPAPGTAPTPAPAGAK